MVFFISMFYTAKRSWGSTRLGCPGRTSKPTPVTVCNRAAADGKWMERRSVQPLRCLYSTVAEWPGQRVKYYLNVKMYSKIKTGTSNTLAVSKLTVRSSSPTSQLKWLKVFKTKQKGKGATSGDVSRHFPSFTGSRLQSQHYFLFLSVLLLNSTNPHERRRFRVSLNLFFLGGQSTSFPPVLRCLKVGGKK